MGFQKPKNAQPHEPSGFTPRSSGRASERARQQGWQTNQEERMQQPEGKQASDGGRDYDYGARDFGDLPVDTSSATSSATGSAKPPVHVVRGEVVRDDNAKNRKKTPPASKKAA